MPFLGIDPGADGAIALYQPAIPAANGAPAIPDFLQVWDMPVDEVTVGRTKRKRLDKRGLLALLDDICLMGAPERIVIEEVAAMPKQSGMFAFGYGVGALHMALVARDLRFEVVTPTTWKRALKAPKDKAEAIVRAEELLPEHRAKFRDTTKSERGKVRPDRAEAALLAFYAATCR